MSDNLQQGCEAFQAQLQPQYGYAPSLGSSIAFATLILVSLSWHLCQAFGNRRYISYTFTTGALIEATGWTARLWSSVCPYNRHAYLIQLTTLMIAPSFVAIGAGLTLRFLMKSLGPSSTFLPANLQIQILLAMESICLIIQALGLGFTTRALDSKGYSTIGPTLLLVGVIVQLASAALFLSSLLDMLYRVRRNFGFTKSDLWLVWPVSLAVLALFIRGLFRTIIGLLVWRGFYFATEYLFLGLDGAMMIIAFGVCNLINPTTLLKSSLLRHPVKIFVDDGGSRSEILYRGAKFKMVRIEDY